MKFAIVESIMTPAGHEIDYDRILVDELKALGHEVEFYVPEKYSFKHDYHVPINYLPGSGVSYAGVSGLAKVRLSAKREINRWRWFKALYQHALDGAYDAVIFPSATYRYLRALQLSSLKKSPVPVIFIIHGVTPSEGPRLFKQVVSLAEFPTIKTVVQTFSQDVLGRTFPNLHCLLPPVYFPRDISYQPTVSRPDVLKLGFFGQYRREKNLDAFLDVFFSCNFQRSVKLIVQGATMKTEDAEDFERIQRKYNVHENVEFWHKALIGKEWQEAIDSVDALLMPYSAERYRYQSSAMLLTAIGFYKPVVIADNMNPEVLTEYDLGVAFPVTDPTALQTSLENFVNTFNDKITIYQSELDRANEGFAPRKLAQGLVELASS